MGTNGAFGGSGSVTWEQVRDEWLSLGNSSDGAGVDDQGREDSSPEESGGPHSADPAYDALIEAIANALMSEDKDTRLPSVPSFPLTAILPRRNGGGGGGGAGGSAGTGSSLGGGGSSSGGRRVTAQAARGGSAIGAATAYRDRDAAALAGYGLTLEELDALSPRVRCARILDVAIGQAGHPDEQAMREASLAQIKALVIGGPDAGAITGLEAVRNFIGELTVRLGLIELRDQILAKSVTAKEALTREKGLRQWVKAKAARLDLGKYGRVATTEFHQVARQMSVDVLRLLRGDS